MTPPNMLNEDSHPTKPSTVGESWVSNCFLWLEPTKSWGGVLYTLNDWDNFNFFLCIYPICTKNTVEWLSHNVFPHADVLWWGFLFLVVCLILRIARITLIKMYFIKIIIILFYICRYPTTLLQVYKSELLMFAFLYMFYTQISKFPPNKQVDIVI